MKKVILGIVIFLIFAGSGIAGYFYFFKKKIPVEQVLREDTMDYIHMENPLIGQQAPDFFLESVKNGKVSLAKLRDGQGAIVFFWATWCPHCRRQLGELNTQAAEIEKKGIKIILIDIGENARQVSSYLEKQGINLDAVLDENSSLSDSYGIVGVPTFYLIDKKGVVKAVEHALPENYAKILSGG